MDLAELNKSIVAALEAAWPSGTRRTEGSMNAKSPDQANKWLKVAELGEQFLAHPDVKSSEEWLTRIMVVLAAMNAHDTALARKLGRKYALEQSPNWHLRSTLPVPAHIDGFPYSEGTPYFNGDYVIVLRDGRRLDATVDRSRQYAAEGSNWTTQEGHIDRHQVACWIATRLT